jgi:hypothetical protein
MQSAYKVSRGRVLSKHRRVFPSRESMLELNRLTVRLGGPSSSQRFKSSKTGSGNHSAVVWFQRI